MNMCKFERRRREREKTLPIVPFASVFLPLYLLSLSQFHPFHLPPLLKQTCPHQHLHHFHPLLSLEHQPESYLQKKIQLKTKTIIA